MRRPLARLSARQRKLAWSLFWMTFGTIALALLVVWIDRARETARINQRADISAASAQEAVAQQTLVRFTDVTAASGLASDEPPPPRRRALPEDNGSGLAWGDYDGDGYIDLYVIRHPSIAPEPGSRPRGNRLYHNNGNGTFTDVTERAGVADPDGFGMGATWVDYDNDGRLDLYVTNRGANRLYHNQGDGTFVEVAEKAGVSDPLWSTGAAWGDFDRDGNIDLYVCNYVNYNSAGREPPVDKNHSGANYEAPYTINPNSYDPQPNHLFRNHGDGTFEDVTERCGVADRDGRSLGATFADLDEDGWLDLYVNNDDTPDRLFHNTGGDLGPSAPVKFMDYSAISGTADTRGSMGLSIAEIGDLNHSADDLPDLFITHWVAQENALYQSTRSSLGQVEYRDRARQFRLGEISIDRVGWGCAFADFDLDGRIDLVVANGSTLEQNDNPLLLKPEPMFIFMNDGTGFRDVAALAGPAIALPYNARGLAVADFDNDGDLDIAITTNEGEVKLFRNDTPSGNRSLTVRLKAPAALCFGAKVEIWCGGRHQIRWYGADVSYLSMHSTDLIFGLGKNGEVDQVRVQWMDGKVSIARRVHAGLAVIEYASTARPAKSVAPR